MNVLAAITIFAWGIALGVGLDLFVVWFATKFLVGGKQMSFGSFLKMAGVDIEKVLGIATGVAEAAEPVVDLLFPGVATLFNGAVNESVKLLAAGTAAAAQGGSAAVQLENVAAAVAPQLIAYAQQEGLPAPTAEHITAFTQAVLAALQVLVSLEGGTTPNVTVTSAAAVSPARAVPAAVMAAAAAQTGPGLHNVVPA